MEHEWQVEEPGREEEEEARILTPHDAAYKRFFSLRLVIISLIEDMYEVLGLDPDIVAILDIDKVEIVFTETVTDNNERRLNDVTYMIPSIRSSEPPYEFLMAILYIFVEFQGQRQTRIHRRMMGYYSSVFRWVTREDESTAPPPQVMSFLLYFGPDPLPAPKVMQMSIYDNNRPGMQFRGSYPERRIDVRRLNLDGFALDQLVPAWCRIEQGRSSEEVVAAFKAIFARFSDAEGDAVCSELYNRATMLGYFREGEEKIAVPYERAKSDILGGRTSMPYMTAIEVQVQESRQEGLQEGRQEGRREQLCRLAAKKFDAATASQLETLLETIDDPTVLNKIGESIIDCDSGGEFIDVSKGLGSSQG